MRSVAAVSLLAAVPAILGGLVLWLLDDAADLTRAVAYGFWVAAALCLVVAAVTTRRIVWRKLPISAYEGWVFTSSAVVLTVVGAIVDTLGAG